MSERPVCPTCGATLSPESGDNCPCCLLGLGLETPLDGQTIEDMLIVRRLGQGGMGVVYLAEDLTLKRQVALKFVKPEVETEQEGRRRFLREARTAASLKHPNICHIYRIGSFQDRTFIAMELVEGETLRSRLASGPVPLPEARQLAIQIADGLAFAHRKGVVHRDLKPENIMVTRDNRVKIMDFGLARLGDEVTAERGESSALTQQGQILGTLEYMSPEQLRGQPATPASDVFSFGLLLAELLAGSHPFKGSTTLEIVSSILKDRPLLGGSRSPISPSLRTVLQSMLEKDPSSRVPSGEELRDPLTRAFGSGPGGVLPLWLKWSALLAALALLAFLWARLLILSPDPIRSLAVLPFEDLSGGETEEYFADGMTDALISRLAQIEGLRVTPRTSSRRYREHNLTARRIATELKVDALVEGTLVRSHQEVEIRVGLIDARADTHLWNETYRTRNSNLLSVQGELAQEIAARVQLQMVPETGSRVSRKQSVDPRALDRYWLGINWMNRRSVAGLSRAETLFRQSLDFDPGFAQAHAGLADVLSLLGDPIFGQLSPRIAMPRVRDAAAQALRLDPSSAEAYTSLANVSFAFDWDWSEAEKHFRRAVALKPSYEVAHQWFALYLAAMGRSEEAIRRASFATELDPLSPLASATLARCHYLQGEFDQALILYNRSLELDPQFRPAHLGIALLLLTDNQLDEALASLKRAFHEQPDLGPLLEALSLRPSPDALTVILGRAEQAARSKDRHLSPFYLAMAAAAVNNQEETLGWLERAVQERSGYIPFLAVDPIFQTSRAHPRFQELLKQANLE